MMISVVIPALNEEKFLPACLESLRNQDYPGEYEIIVADNGSTDNTASIARKFGARVVACPEKKNVFYARQKGAETARGDIIAQADADSIYFRDWLGRIARQFASHPEAVAVAGRFLYMDPPSWAQIEYFLRHNINRLTKFLFGRPLLVSGATFAFRKKAFFSENGYHNIPYKPDQYGICGRLQKVGEILYDGNLRILTSSRSVKKPFLVVVGEAVVNLSGWGIYFGQHCLSALSQSAMATRPRRIALRLAPLGMLLILFIAYGYFIPASPVFGKVYYKGNATEKVVALTFDDGPNDPYTSEVLDVLARYKVKATFFVIGRNVELYPETARRILAEGHVLGNHSYSHDANHALSPYGARDMRLAQVVIFHIIGVWPHLYRPPHGKKTPWELQQVNKGGLVEVTWSVSTNELNTKSAESVAQKIVSKTEPGEIILLHDGYGTEHNNSRADKSLTVEALPLIIAQLQAKGYRFVTIPELLGVPAYHN